MAAKDGTYIIVSEKSKGGQERRRRKNKWLCPLSWTTILRTERGCIWNHSCKLGTIEFESGTANGKKREPACSSCLSTSTDKMSSKTAWRQKFSGSCSRRVMLCFETRVLMAIPPCIPLTSCANAIQTLTVTNGTIERDHHRLTFKDER